MNTGIIIIAATISAIGVVIAVINFKMKKAQIDMSMFPFLNRLIFGKGYTNISAVDLKEKLSSGTNDILLADLRIKEEFNKGHIDGALSIHFDDFIRELVIEEKLKDDHDTEIIVICDTGHMSRVAGAILIEEGFTNKVYNLKGGMKKWSYDVETNFSEEHPVTV